MATRRRSTARRPPRSIVEDRLTEVEAQTRANRKHLDIQFHRIAQLQAQIDQIQAAWKRLKK